MMNKQLYGFHPTDLEQHASAEADRRFAECFEQFKAGREAVERLHWNLANLALAANLAASRPRNCFIQVDDGELWHKDANLLDRIFLCHRCIGDVIEYAVVEHFPAHDRNEIWNRGLEAVEVLMVFGKEQRQALKVWLDDLTAQLKEFLADQYSGQDVDGIADRFMDRFFYEDSLLHNQEHEQNQRFARP